MRDRLCQLAILVLGAGCLAWARALSFVCDDAYISFRYARNLIEGHGLVFNPGEWVEGYTNFLWVLELAAIWAVTGVEPPDASIALSLGLTAGTLGLTMLLALRTPQTTWRWPVAMAAVALLATHRSVAVWATSGLETRQFTFLVLLGVLLTATPGRRALAGGATALGLAELTRPEALLIGPITLAVRLLRTWRAGGSLSAELAATTPFALLVGGQLVWRLATYGVPLPNTWYAKSVRPWWDAGVIYLGVAALEHALYLTLPLALVGLVVRTRAGEASLLTALAWAIPLLGFLARQGGDHFEFRALDELWPFLAVGAAEGLAAIAWTVGARTHRPAAGAAVAGACLAASVAYGLIPQLAHERGAAALQGRKQTVGMVVPLADRPDVAWLPGLPWLLRPYDEGAAFLADHWIAARRREHEDFAEMRLALWGGYARWSGALLPPGAVSSQISVGVVPWLLPDLVVIDEKGLTDATVARTPVLKPDAKRRMAHDRQATPGYLAQRGVNVDVLPLKPTRAAALKAAPFAVRLADDAWMPLDGDPDWIRAAFTDRDLHARPTPSAAPPPTSGWRGAFDDGLDGWTRSGAAFADPPLPGPRGRQRAITGATGGLLNSFHETEGDAATGTVTSPAFTVAARTVLRFRVGGGDRPGVGVFLVGAEGARGSWRGARSETLTPVEVPLDPWEGQTLWIEVRDAEVGGWGHVLADAFEIVPAP